MRNGESAYEWIAGGSRGPAPNRRPRLRTPSGIPGALAIIERPQPIEVALPDDGRTRYPWASMRPGDGFLVPCEPDEMEGVVHKLAAAGRDWFRRYRPELAVATRRVKRGVRVWVVEAA